MDARTAEIICRERKSCPTAFGMEAQSGESLQRIAVITPIKRLATQWQGEKVIQNCEECGFVAEVVLETVTIQHIPLMRYCNNKHKEKLQTIKFKSIV